MFRRGNLIVKKPLAALIGAAAALALFLVADLLILSEVRYLPDYDPIYTIAACVLTGFLIFVVGNLSFRRQARLLSAFALVIIVLTVLLFIASFVLNLYAKDIILEYSYGTSIVSKIFRWISVTFGL
ncbi:MAG: hypothetical protein LBT20_06475 [Clostridiales bacterium]|jgi:hypothetical protein|nr:hypothetical protein [Clostridiales bacterium]